MNRWQYIKTFDRLKDDIYFSEIISFHIAKYNGAVACAQIAYEIKQCVAHIIHCFYPFEPISDVMFDIGVYIDTTTHINLNTYDKYLNDKWSVVKIKKELRLKKLTRISNAN